MSYEWVGQLVTGAVGALGIIATWLGTGRQVRSVERAQTREHQHQREETRREERKAAYARFLAARATVRNAVSSVVTHRQRDTVSSSTIEATSAAHTMNLVAAEIELLAPNEIGVAAKHVALDTWMALRRALRDSEATLPTEEEADRFVQLQKLMREDLAIQNPEQA